MDPTFLISISSFILSLTGLVVSVLTHIQYSECRGCIMDTNGSTITSTQATTQTTPTTSVILDMCAKV